MNEKHREDYASRVRPSSPGLLLLALCLAGCARSPSEPPAPAPAALSVVDDAGRTVRLPAPARRVLSLSPSTTELVFAVGAGDLLVGRTVHCDHPPAAAAVPAVGSLFPPDYERILATRPDLVLMLDGSLDVRQRLEARGLTTFVLQPPTVEAVAKALRTVGALVGRSAPAEAAAKRFKTALAAVHLPAGPGPRVYYEIASQPMVAAGPKGFVGDALRRAGARDALGIDAEWPQVTAEQVIGADPEVIITTSAEARDAILRGDRPGFSAITAVRTRRVYAVPNADWLSRFGPRVVDGVTWLAKVLPQGAAP
ncbi:MAG: ABC transporter substrate-binding protein [Myxococcales bacterium]|nr:ABC transporter substrate-binding protein [Myxococcales bacterium]